MAKTIYSNEPYADLYGEEVMNLLRAKTKQDEELDLIAPIGMPDSVDRETGELLDIFDEEEEIAFCNECENTCTKAALTFDRECPFCLSDEISFGRLEDFPASDEPLDSSSDGEALASAGFGTDEDYGFYGEFE